MDAPDPVVIGLGPLTPAQVVAVARHGAPVALADEAREAIARARKAVDDLVAGDTPVYGLST
ncbi:MAG TPA: aromatic amino acid lyase, partial [Acidimicrobiales bacterium]|nr:aromatic amino acid lyase [Acidimicrobiales bacterium]